MFSPVIMRDFIDYRNRFYDIFSQDIVLSANLKLSKMA
jgi:hypothetical protein